mgnify:FL=1
MNPDIFLSTQDLLVQATLKWNSMIASPSIVFSLSMSGNNNFPVNYYDNPILFYDSNSLAAFGFAIPAGTIENPNTPDQRHRIAKEDVTIENITCSEIYVNVSSSFYNYTYDISNNLTRRQTWNTSNTDYVTYNTLPETHSFSLKKLLKHEMGHILGFGHVNNPQNVMNGEITDQPDFTSWGNEDYDFVSLLYPIGSSENEDQNIINKQKANFGIYPNPARDQLTFELKTDRSAQDYEISIYNIKGQLVKRAPFHQESKINWKFDSTDNQNISSGIYFAVLKENGAIISSKKIMIIK